MWVIKQDSSHFFPSDSVYAIPTYWAFSPDTSNSKYKENRWTSLVCWKQYQTSVMFP